jgi:hypothetical protein
LKAYKKKSYWQEVRPTLEKELEKGTALSTLAFYYDVSPRRMEQVLEMLDLPQPEVRTAQHDEHDVPQGDMYTGGSIADVSLAIDAAPASRLDSDGNGRMYDPGSIGDGDNR